jgi:hypothetical protein
MAVERVSGGSSLIDVLDRVLDKGIVIDAWVRISLVGLDLITVEARVVVASIDTYLKYADAVGIVGLVSRPQLGAEAEIELETRRPARVPGRRSRRLGWVSRPQLGAGVEEAEVAPETRRPARLPARRSRRRGWVSRPQLGAGVEEAEVAPETRRPARLPARRSRRRG